MDRFLNKLKSNIFGSDMVLVEAVDFNKAQSNINGYGMVANLLGREEFIDAFRNTHVRLYYILGFYDTVFSDCEVVLDEDGNPRPAPTTGIHLPWADTYSTWMVS
jgi:hypothetical protein